MPPPVLEHARDLLSRYDVLLCDVWGVVHNGHRAFPAACEALANFRDEGGTVILLTNAPQPAERVARILDDKLVPTSSWDAIVSSGDVALEHVRQRGYQRIHHIGPVPRSRPLMSHLPGLTGSLEEADAIVCSGLVDDSRETAEDYRRVLLRAHALGLPLVCANPDLVVDVGGTLLPCAGALGALYEEIGGEVYWAGKPHAPVYEGALRRAAELRGRDVARTRVLAIGDALRTDLAGAANAGFDALFIASGIHRHETMSGDSVEPRLLAGLFDASAPPAVAAMSGLAW
jgi:HAD superfamily hydrolase (TIGR01459 family)